MSDETEEPPFEVTWNGVFLLVALIGLAIGVGIAAVLLPIQLVLGWGCS